MQQKRHTLISVGSVYVETNYIGIDSAGSDILTAGKEYRSRTYQVRAAGSAVTMASQAAALGVSAYIVGKRGADDAGRELETLLTDQSLHTDLLITDPSVQTSINIGLVLSHNGQHVLAVSGNANQSLTLGDIPLNHAAFSACDGVYLGGFYKQDGLYKEYPALCASLKNMGKQVFLDHGRVPVDSSVTKRTEYLLKTLPFVDIYFPNEEELFSLTQERSVESAIHKASSFGPSMIVVKQGERGCTVFHNSTLTHIDAITTNAVNTVGAGDAFNGAFLTEYLHGSSPVQSARFATKVAALRVSGKKIVTMHDLKNV